METSKISILEGLSAADLLKVVKHFQRRSFKRGQVLGNTITKLGRARDNEVYFVLDGRIKESTVTLSGKELIYNILKQGDCVGLIPTLFGATPYQSEFIALTDGKMIAINSHIFCRLVSKYQSISQAILSEFSKNIANLSTRLYELRALDASQRTRAEVLRHAVPEGADTCAMFASLPTHEDIACSVFSHREAITKELSSLKKKGLIQQRKGHLYIPDARKLESTLPELPRKAFSMNLKAAV